MSKEKRYYIAYGSNLNVEQMMRRCPGAKPIGTAMLEHNILYFRGSGSGYYLTIEPKIGSKVPVAVWEVTQSGKLPLRMKKHSTATRAIRDFISSTITPSRSGCLTKRQQRN